MAHPTLNILAAVALATAVAAVPLLGAGGITVSRTIKSSDIAGAVTVDGTACTSKDQWGSNDCTMSWGSKYDVHYNVSLTQDIEAGSTIVLDLKLKTGIIPVPLKATCPLCGGNCTIDIPLIKQKIDFAMPPCPIKAASLPAGALPFTLPADPLKPPLPKKLGVSGTISAVDKSGKHLLDASIEVELS
jgi:hypothetical protein